MFASVQRLGVGFEHQAALRFLSVMTPEAILTEKGSDISRIIGR